MSEQHVKARNPEPRLDVVRIGGGDRLKLLQGLCVRSRSCEALGLGALSRRRRLRRGEQHRADNDR
jgi:hypothetical protein